MIALVISLTATLGCIALSLGMFVLGKLPPGRTPRVFGAVKFKQDGRDKEQSL